MVLLLTPIYIAVICTSRPVLLAPCQIRNNSPASRQRARPVVTALCQTPAVLFFFFFLSQCRLLCRMAIRISTASTYRSEKLGTTLPHNRSHSQLNASMGPGHVIQLKIKDGLKNRNNKIHLILGQLLNTIKGFYSYTREDKVLTRKV